MVAQKGNLGQSNYAASKAGVLGLTRSLSKELASSNIRVNCVLPGFIQTPMSDSVPEKIKNAMVTKISLGRFGKTQNIADLVKTFVKLSISVRCLQIVKIWNP